MYTTVGNLVEPPADLDVGRADIKMQSALFQPGLQRIRETVPQVTVEPFDLSLGLGAIRLAQQRSEAEMSGHIPQGRMRTMLSRTVGIPLQHQGAHVVIERLFGHPFKELERMLVTASKRLDVPMARAISRMLLPSLAIIRIYMLLSCVIIVTPPAE